MKSLGKFGQQLRGVAELSPEMGKTILNTVITGIKSTIPKMAPEDIEKLQQRLGKDGKQIEEEEELGLNLDAPQEGGDTAELNLNESWSSVKQLTKMLVNYEVNKKK